LAQEREIAGDRWPWLAVGSLPHHGFPRAERQLRAVAQDQDFVALFECRRPM
jgi:hypothetical protein